MEISIFSFLKLRRNLVMNKRLMQYYDEAQLLNDMAPPSTVSTDFSDVNPSILQAVEEFIELW